MSRLVYYAMLPSSNSSNSAKSLLSTSAPCLAHRAETTSTKTSTITGYTRTAKNNKQNF